MTDIYCANLRCKYNDGALYQKGDAYYGWCSCQEIETDCGGKCINENDRIKNKNIKKLLVDEIFENLDLVGISKDEFADLLIKKYSTKDLVKLAIEQLNEINEYFEDLLSQQIDKWKNRSWVSKTAASFLQTFKKENQCSRDAARLKNKMNSLETEIAYKLKNFHKGRGKAIHYKRLAFVLDINERIVRQIVAGLITGKQLPIASSQEGYWWIDCEDEFKLAHSEIINRIKALSRRAKGLRIGYMKSRQEEKPRQLSML